MFMSGVFFPINLSSCKNVALNEFTIMRADNGLAAVDFRTTIVGLIFFDIIIATALNNLLNLRPLYSKLVKESMDMDFI